MKTIFLKQEDVARKWWLVDAENQVLGRLASRIVTLLRGKHKASYTPNIEMGDWVVVVNADKVKVTGKKMTDKIYYRFSGYPSGLKSVTLGKLIARRPTVPLEKAIKGMLPRGKMGRKLFKNVKIYAGPTHPHAAQKPEKIEL